jgi:glucoamylase
MLRSRVPASLFGVLVAIALTTPCVALGAPAPSGAAADGPGQLSHFDLARKDCLGTARNQTSKVWFTVAGGMLSDVYFPTEDNTNVETMQYVVARGGGVDLQARDMTYTVRALDDRALSCRVTVTGPDARYRITTDYVTDPARATVLMRTRFTPLRGRLDDYRLYVRLDPTLNGNGGGGAGNGGADSADVATADGHTLLVGSDTNTATNAANRDYAVPVHSALDGSRPFLRVSNGFAGASSDGLTQLTAHGELQDEFATAAGGNTVQTAQLDLRHSGRLVLGLGFGDGRAAAIGAVRGSLDGGFRAALDLRAAMERV